MSVIRNENGEVSQAITVHQVVFERLADRREFSVMDVMKLVNQMVLPEERLTVVQVSKSLERLARGDDRIRRVAAGRYRWAWAVEVAR